MSCKLGYLIPTRESVMRGRPQTGPLLALARRAEALGYDSVWVGDSLLDRPRHEPLTLLAGIAGCTERLELGTAVLLPGFRNPVVMAHQIATLDQLCEGRLILGVGIASDRPSIRAEFDAAEMPFERRVGRMMEGLRLCRALWSGEPVSWDGRWKLEHGVLGPVPYRAGGPPIWGGGGVVATRKRAGEHFDGWFPTGPFDPREWGRQWQEVRAFACEAGRNADELSGAAYLTVAIDDDRTAADAQISAFFEQYYGAAAAGMRKDQASLGGPLAEVAEWLRGYVDAGAQHLVVRFSGDHERQLEQLISIRDELG